MSQSHHCRVGQNEAKPVPLLKQSCVSLLPSFYSKVEKPVTQGRLDVGLERLAAAPKTPGSFFPFLASPWFPPLQNHSSGSSVPGDVVSSEEK